MKYTSVSCEFSQFNINSTGETLWNQLNSISKIALTDCTSIYNVTYVTSGLTDEVKKDTQKKLGCRNLLAAAQDKGHWRQRPAQGCKPMMKYYSRPVHHNHDLTPVLIPDWYDTTLYISAQWAIIKPNSTE